jgi:hypothetical protein
MTSICTPFDDNGLLALASREEGRAPRARNLPLGGASRDARTLSREKDDDDDDDDDGGFGGGEGGGLG